MSRSGCIFQEKRYPLFFIQYAVIQEKGPVLNACILKCQNIIKHSFTWGGNNLVYQFGIGDLFLDKFVDLLICCGHKYQFTNIFNLIYKIKYERTTQ